MNLGLKQLGLTEKRAQFLRHLAAGESVEVAYSKAYPKAKPRSVKANAHKTKNMLLHDPKVREWFDANFVLPKTAESKKVLLTIEQRKAVLAEIIKNGKTMEKLKALDIYNKMEAVYEHRTKVEGDVALTIGWGDDHGK